MSEIDELKARVAELERRVGILFTKTGALDLEEVGRGAPEPSAEVQSLLADGQIRKAVKRYQEETGADMATAMAAIGKLGEGG